MRGKVGLRYDDGDMGTFYKWFPISDEHDGYGYSLEESLYSILVQVLPHYVIWLWDQDCIEISCGFDYLNRSETIGDLVQRYGIDNIIIIYTFGKREGK